MEVNILRLAELMDRSVELSGIGEAGRFETDVFSVQYTVFSKMGIF